MPENRKEQEELQRLEEMRRRNLTKEAVIGVLKDIYDPEIPVNIWDLGLIYALEIDPEKRSVYILMTVTAPGCPVAEPLRMMVEDRLRALGFEDVKVELTFDPPWSIDRMTEEGKEILRAMGYPI